MKEEWLFHGGVVPIDVETTAALVAEIKRLIDVIGGMALAQTQESVAFASHGVVNWIADKQFQHEANLYIAPQRKPLTDEEIEDLYFDKFSMGELKDFARAIEAAHDIKE